MEILENPFSLFYAGTWVLCGNNKGQKMPRKPTEANLWDFVAANCIKMKIFAEIVCFGENVSLNCIKSALRYILKFFGKVCIMKVLKFVPSGIFLYCTLPGGMEAEESEEIL